MSSGVVLRTQIASVIDALSKAAAAEIAKVVEDGMVVLRLEMCQRENEIEKLKSNIEILHSELRAAQERAKLRPETGGRDDSQGGAEDQRTARQHVPADISRTSPPAFDVRVKREPVEEACGESTGRAGQPGGDLFEGSVTRWRPTAHTDMGLSDSDNPSLLQTPLPALPESSLDSRVAVSYSSAGMFQHSPFVRGPPGFSPFRNLCNTVRRRTVKRLMFKKGFPCLYCGKSFERSGHLERHKRIHTGEKPYRCEICGRRFNQKCSLKEHTKIHRRSAMEAGAVHVSGQKPPPEEKPSSTAHPAEAETPTAAESVPVKTEEDATPTAVQVKSEPVEENVTPPLFVGENPQLKEETKTVDEDSDAPEPDGPQWTSRLQTPKDVEMSSTERVDSSAPNVLSFPGAARFLPPQVEATCSTFSFAGSSFEGLKNMPQPPYGSSQSLLLPPGEAGCSDQRNKPLRMLKPKKYFICSYCGKIFERAGHLERHLRIHTGEKPYGCPICGRCFNQKCSLKGHMKTHRNDENTDMLGGHHLMLPLDHLSESKPGFSVLDGQLSASSYGETVKSATAAEQSLCVFLNDYQLSSAAGGANEWRDYAPSIGCPPFLDAKVETSQGDPFSQTGLNPTQAPDQHVIQEVTVGENGVGGGRPLQDGGGFAYKHEDVGGAAAQNCFICSACGRSFENFTSFQSHQCKRVSEQPLRCDICGEVFDHTGVLKLHLKMHVGQ